MSAVPHRRFGRAVAFSIATVVAGATAAAQYPITRVSVDSAGNESNSASGFWGPSGGISSDGRFVAFTSYASNLVAGDANGFGDIFVRDRVAGTTVRVSVDLSGIQGDGPSQYPAMSSDGRFVSFTSSADNLVSNDTNHWDDVFRHDRDPDGNGIFDEGNGVTERVSVDSAGAEANSLSITSGISGDGNFVVFSSFASNLVANDGNDAYDVFLHDCTTGITTRITKGGNGHSLLPSISGDGNRIAFTSFASNLVPGDTNNGEDVFVWDRTASTTTRVSVDSSGNQSAGTGPSPLSDDGSIVAFASLASNLVAGDTNGTSDVFVHDLGSGATTRESVDPGGVQFDDDSDSPTLSADGNVVAFMRHVMKLGGQGWYPDDYRPYARDRAADVSLALNVNCGGEKANGNGMYPTVSADGTIVAFLSYASDLVANDTNGTGDVFAYDRTIVEPDASWTNYGSGFPGTLGTPSLTSGANPVLGTSTHLDVQDSLGTTTVGFLLVGWNAASIGTHFGGVILVDAAWAKSTSIARSGRSFPIAPPIDPALCGLSLFAQVVEVDPGAAHGLSFTPRLELVFGK